MINLREIVEADLATTIQGEFQLPVELIDPDGVEYTGIKGHVRYETIGVNPETLEPMTIDEPVVTLRRSSLTRVPVAGESWLVRIPETPSTTAPLADFVSSTTRPPIGGKSIGFVKIYLQKALQV